MNNTFTVPCKKSKIICFAPSIMKSIVVFVSYPRFPVKLVYCIAFGSASSAHYLLKPTSVSL